MRPCKPAFTSCVFMKFSLMYRLCYYTTDSLLFKQNFLKEIRTTFGAGGFVCSLSEKELSEFHQYLEKGFPFNDPAKVKKGISYAGLQPEDNVWVLNKHLQIDAQGRQIAPNSMKYAWQPLGGPCIETTGKGSTIVDLQSEIQLPLQSAEPLRNLLEVMQTIFKHNVIPS